MSQDESGASSPVAATAPRRIYLSPPWQTGTELEHLQDVLASNWLAPVGPQIAEFERRVAEIAGVKHAVALASGTAAIHLGLRGLGVRRGDDVVCSTLTFCASANPILYEGARPVFIDSEPDSWNMDPTQLEDCLAAAARRGRKPRAIVVVDVFGQSADMETLTEIARRYEIPILEDAAEALGTTYRGQHVGNRAEAVIFSFNGNKMITTSGGGMLCSNDRRLIEEARFVSQQSRDPAPHYQHSRLGFNYRMSNLVAAVGLAQLESLDQRVAARRQIFEYYTARLGHLDGLSFMPEAAFGTSSRWLSVMLVDPTRAGTTRDHLREALEQRNIESRPVWKPLHCQPLFAGCPVWGGAVAEQLFAHGLCLPSGTGMTTSELDLVVDCIAERHGGRRATRRAA